MQTSSRSPQDSHGVLADSSREQAERTIWYTLGVLYRWRFFIVAVTGLMAVLSVVISLWVLQPWYRSSARLLLPTQSGMGSLSSALLGDFSSVAQGFLGGSVGDYTRYIAILTSQTVLGEVVDRFNLVEVYELEEGEAPRVDAIDQLAEYATFVVDEEYEFFSIEVLDTDPQRAADMANYFVEVLNRFNSQLTSQTAANFRRYVEQRYARSEVQRDSVLNALRDFQAQYGVYDLTAQSQAFFEQLAELRGDALAAEIQYEVLREQFGATNPQVKSYQRTVEAANRMYRDALAGREQILPVSQDTIPNMIRAYADLELQRLIQERILEIVAPTLEQAYFEEQRQTEALQVIDPATPPVEKAKPQRTLIVIAATLSGGILSVLFALLYTWVRRHYRYAVERITQEAQQA